MNISARLESRLVDESSPSLRKLRPMSALGFLVTDTDLRVLSVNHEAVVILTYEEKDARVQNLAEVYERKLRNNLLRRHGLPAAIQFESGRRTYFCRVFQLDSNRKTHGSPAVLLVLERGVSESMALTQVSEQFRLTRREQEAVMLLLEGLSNKEMAERMAISANTVKALLCLVMRKMQVTSRAAVAATVLGLITSFGDRQNS